MRTGHKVIFGDSRDMGEILSEEVNFVVTSPPYPMIEMWDEQFSFLNPEVNNSLQEGDGSKAYNLMHRELNKVWKQVDRVLAPGGIVCINIGDATRKLNGSFQLYANHSRIIHYFEEMNYQVMPPVIWRKQSTKPNKFMGSGMLPPNAYVTLDHEYILIFRKGGSRQFDPKEKEIRRRSAFFWEERNNWFSDIWYDLKGIAQKLNHKELREKSAAYPFELAYRLINMYSIQNDTVLDPFVGTGTTTMAAMVSARNSIGYELDTNFYKIIDNRINEVLDMSKDIVTERLRRHVQFVRDREKEKGELGHKSSNYGFPVMTSQEREIFLPVMKSVNKKKEHENTIDYVAEYRDEIPEISIEKDESSKTAQKRVNLSDFC